MKIIYNINIQYKIMKVTINEKTIELKYNFRMFYLYENLMEKSFNFQDIKITNMVDLLYCAVLARQQYLKLDLLRYDDYMNWLEDNDADKTITEFMEWIYNNVALQSELSEKPELTENTDNVEADEKN